MLYIVRCNRIVQHYILNQQSLWCKNVATKIIKLWGEIFEFFKVTKYFEHILHLSNLLHSVYTEKLSEIHKISFNFSKLNEFLLIISSHVQKVTHFVTTYSCRIHVYLAIVIILRLSR